MPAADPNPLHLNHPCFLQDLPDHWEKRLSHAVKMMVDKHELVHVPSHPGMYKMGKKLEDKLARKTGPRKPKVNYIVGQVSRASAALQL
jgi:hypothetical protein